MWILCSHERSQFRHQTLIIVIESDSGLNTWTLNASSTWPIDYAFSHNQTTNLHFWLFGELVHCTIFELYSWGSLLDASEWIESFVEIDLKLINSMNFIILSINLIITDWWIKTNLFSIEFITIRWNKLI